MATSNQIRSATHRPKPRSKDGIDVDRLNLIPDADPADFPFAREYVKRLGNRHGCGKNCTHPKQHHEDVADALQVMHLLGLKDDPVASVQRERRMSPEVKPSLVTEAQQRWRMVSKYLRADHSWMVRGSCRGEDSELFFPADHERQPEREIREEKARAVCAVCPVKDECLDYAVKTSQVGFWGGADDEQRKGLRRREQRQSRRAA